MRIGSRDNMIHGLLEGKPMTTEQRSQAEARRQARRAPAELVVMDTLPEEPPLSVTPPPGPTPPPSQPGADPGGKPVVQPPASNPPPAPAGGGPVQPTDPAGKLPELVPDPVGLEIVSQEREFMEVLSPLLGRSPRALKRFINVYRLLKAGLDSTELDAFMAGKGSVSRYRAILLLLAVVTGMPSISQLFFRTLREGPADGEGRAPGTLGEFAKVLETRLPEGKPMPRADWERLNAWIGSEDQSGWYYEPLAPLKLEARRVARFSFRVEGI